MKLIKVASDHFIIQETVNHVETILYSTPHPVTLKHNVQELSLSEVKELIGEVDVEKKTLEHFANYWIKEDGTQMSSDEITADMMAGMLMEKCAYKAGYNQCLEDNKDKKYTEEDLVNAKITALERYLDWNEEVAYDAMRIIERLKSSLPKPLEWEVEFVDGKLKLKSWKN